MSSKTIVFLLLLVATVAFALPGRDYDRSREDYRRYRSNEDRDDNGDEEDRSYEFRYQVNDESEELDFGHREEKSSGEVEGYYYVLLPDSRILHVKYTADDENGYEAEVHFEGSAEYESQERYEEEKPKYRRRYRGDSRER
ncbi:UNVERIFIED_CONTAM: hypothetical protein RMT77_013765 [Armadillidium vulgare]